MVDTLYFATSNPDKVRETREILGMPIEHIELDIPEVQALEVEAVVRAKATSAYRMTGKRVIVEDTGLYIETWEGLPGALIRWFMKTVGNDGICRMLGDASNRKVTARTAVAVFDGAESIVAIGEIRGTIPLRPMGDEGFGWDAVFQPCGSDKTFAEMEGAEKNAISMRRVALERLRDRLLLAEG